MQFKIGDKVKLLPSVVSAGVVASEVGKIGIVTFVGRLGGVHVKTSQLNRFSWCLQEYNIAPAVKVGQQLLFSFMS